MKIEHVSQPETKGLFPIVSKYWWVSLLVSSLLVLISLVSLGVFRLKPSIDFTGGSLLVVQFPATVTEVPSQSVLQEAAGDTFHIERVQQSDKHSLTLRTTAMSNEQKTTFLGKLQKTFGKVTEQRFETLGPAMGRELLVKTLLAVGVALLCITLYLGYRFASWQYGIAAAVAAIHDAILVLGVFSLLGQVRGVEVDVLFVTAVLTILSFSVHDTIVVFDRIRERLSKEKVKNVELVVDQAVFETLNRSMRNSLAIIILLLTLFLFGAISIQWFILALLIGTITGTYSSTFVAMPILILWQRIATKIKKLRR